MLSAEMAKMMVEPVADGIPVQAPFKFSQALGFSVLHFGSERRLIRCGGNFPGYISGILLQPQRGFGVVVMTNAWSGYELIWEVFYSVLYAYGILPTAGQVAGIAYSVVLSMAALTIWPIGGLAKLLRGQRSASQTQRTQEGKVARPARVVLGLLVLGILLLTLLYRGPLGGYLVVDLNTAYTQRPRGHWASSMRCPSHSWPCWQSCGTEGAGHRGDVFSTRWWRRLPSWVCGSCVICGR